MPERLDKIIETEPGLENVRRVMKQAAIAIDFSEIFPEFEKVVTVIKTEKKVLHLKVENPAWRNELKFKENLIISKINSHYKEERIKWIKFHA
jgi:hypothetical protein